MLHHNNIAFIFPVTYFSYSTILFYRIKIKCRIVQNLFGKIDRRAACIDDIGWIFPHSNHPFTCIIRCNQMYISQLGIGMSYFFVNVSGDFTALYVCKRNILIRCSNGCGNRLKPICNTYNNIRFNVVKNICQLHECQTSGFSHCCRCFTF